MLKPRLDPLATGLERLRLWLDRPLSKFWCVIGWLGATMVFLGTSTLLGGPTEGDSVETVYATWSIEHVNLACAYPLGGGEHITSIANPFALAAPLYPVLTGVAAALFRIGHSVPFPTQHQLGRNCTHAFVTMFNWSVKSSSELPTVHLAYLVWPVLMAGVIALLRASDRGRRGWEPATLLLIACLPTVLMCITYFFHPQDVLAIALIVGGVACSLRGRWVWAGALLGLAFCSQQFAVLVAVPLLIVAPGHSRARFAAGALAAAAVIDIPLIVATSGRGIKTILLGSSRVGSNIRAHGGTVLWETDLRGILLFLISRVLPVVAAAALAWWASRRLGSRLLAPVPLMSLVATSLAFRLVFEENLFGYYFMAVAVSLVMLDVMGGRLRGYTVAWLALLTVAFNPFHVGFVSNLTSRALPLYNATPIVLLALFVLSVTYDALHRRFRVYKIVWIVVVALTIENRLWGLSQSILVVPRWLWQVILVPLAIVLAVGPLLAAMKKRDAREPVPV